MAWDRRRCRLIVVRAVRVGGVVVLAGGLIGLLTLFYLHRVGFPDSVKRHVQSAFRARGLDLTFKRLTLDWSRGLVAEAVKVEFDHQPGTPQATAAELTLRPDWSALWRGRFRLETVWVRDGHFTLNVAEPREPPSVLRLDDLVAHLRFGPGDTWDLTHVTARCLGIKVALAGTLTHPSALRYWANREVGSRSALTAKVWRAQLRHALAVWRQIHFRQPPTVNLRFQGDGRKPATLTVDLQVRAAAATMPGGEFEDLSLHGQLRPASAALGWLRTHLELAVGEIGAHGVVVESGRFTADLTNSPSQELPIGLATQFSARTARIATTLLTQPQLQSLTVPTSKKNGQWLTTLQGRVGEIRDTWGTIHSNRFRAQLVQTFRDWLPDRAKLRLTLQDVGLRRGTIGGAEFTLAAERQTNAVTGPLDWQTLTQALRATGTIQLESARFGSLRMKRATADGQWNSPTLTLSRCLAELPGGSVRVATARLDTDSRVLHWQGESDCDLRALAVLLPSAVAVPLRAMAWNRPPHLGLSGALNLPGWTKFASTPAAQWLARLHLNARLAVGPASFHGFAVQSLEGAATLAHQFLVVSRLILRRPEGSARLRLEGNLRSHAYQAHVASTLDPAALRPLLGKVARKPLKLFEFTRPPHLTLEAWGRGRDLDRLALAAHVALTNFEFRGEHCDSFVAGLRFTNRFLFVTNAELRAGSEWIQAPALGLDTRSSWLYFTNARSRMDPQRIARAIGEHPAHTIAPYRFLRPPLACVNGHVPVRGSTESADMTFDLDGGPFRYWRFDLPQVVATVHWRGNHVTITNLNAAFYGGRLGLHLEVEAPPREPAILQFESAVTNADLHALISGLVSPTNRLQGVVSGQLNITHANSDDWKSWAGAGRVSMHDGFLWDFPLFAIFSKALDVLAPGTGDARATAAQATYTITNSVIHTDNLSITATPLKLRGRGDVDFAGHVDGRVEAEVLRGVPLIGPIVSLVFMPLTKALAYRVTGTLGDPRAVPLHVPRLLNHVLGLSHQPSARPASTNAPPARSLKR